MTELWSLSPIYHKLEHEPLVYQEASDILESLFGKPRKYSSYKDFLIRSSETTLCIYV